ncbi:MAG: hypothetical protein Q4E64_03920 [Phascolarctobacterium sp.]|uniref:hypothetical protein n=1 Tax=Phascolarctobacterium sp. TaxID=2049039 RepID=UPI0026DD9CAE|nr:hypothetical protein [Phascolarctobacterium sp.]MDO4920961.1 hypothetical protein [Phascolarctobacterium sp.]
MRQCEFIFTAANYKGTCDVGILGQDKPLPEFSLQRLAAYIEAKKRFDKELRNIPGGNRDLISKLYEVFDELIMDEFKLAKAFNGNFNSSK